MGLLSTKLGAKTIAHFCRMLAQNARGPVQIDRSLELLMGPDAPAPLRRALLPVRDRIRRGGTLAEAFDAQRRDFPEDFLELVSAALRDMLAGRGSRGLMGICYSSLASVSAIGSIVR